MDRDTFNTVNQPVKYAINVTYEPTIEHFKQRVGDCVHNETLEWSFVYAH